MTYLCQLGSLTLLCDKVFVGNMTFARHMNSLRKLANFKALLMFSSYFVVFKKLVILHYASKCDHKTMFHLGVFILFILSLIIFKAPVLCTGHYRNNRNHGIVPALRVLVLLSSGEHGCTCRLAIRVQLMNVLPYVSLENPGAHGRNYFKTGEDIKGFSKGCGRSQ